MSTLNEREAVLRRALHSAADVIEPRPDGLERIRARVSRPRPVPVAWAEALWTDLWLRAPAGLRSVLDRVPRAMVLAWTRFGPRPGRTGSRASRTLGWLRPAAALGVTVFIVAAGAYVAINAQQSVNLGSSNSRPTQGAGTGGHNGDNSGKTASRRHSPVTTGSPSPSATASCKPRKPASPASSAPTSIQPTSPSTTPSPSVSPSPSTSDSSSPDPSSTGPGASSASAAVVTTPSLDAVAAAGLADAAANVSHSAAAKPSPCPTKRTNRNTAPVVSPNAAAAQPMSGEGAAVSAGRLNEDG
jgi:hypothetical protein